MTEAYEIIEHSYDVVIVGAASRSSKELVHKVLKQSTWPGRNA
jgi:hypothetical protein